MHTTGSLWQKWDLHVHTPASYQWTGGRFPQDPAQRDMVCKSIIDRMNDLDIVAFCIMDYWTFDGYIALRNYLDRNPNCARKRIFPGIELRLAAPTDFRLNTHVLLNDEVSTESLGHFFSHLRLAGSEESPPSRQHLIELGRSYDSSKLKLYGCTTDDKGDEEKMHLVGLKSALITRESVRKAIDVVGKEHCIVIQPYDTSDGLEELDWQCHPYTDSYLMKWADCFETRNQTHVDLFLGRGHKTKPHVGFDFIENLGGHPKPVVAGSDAHRIADYGVYPSNRATWLKAQPTFKGLRQVCHEPALRCFIGVRPPKLEHVDQNPTKYIRSLRLEKSDGSTLDEHWFHGTEVNVNPGLVAIIGNKGSGKSALADILALAGNSHCTNMEFLNNKRFRSGPNKAKHFSATLEWSDGTIELVPLHQDIDKQQPERVRYLPQHFIEDLCNEIATGNETDFGKELRKVIFSHVPPEKQLRMGTLDDLLDYLIDAKKKAIQQFQQQLHTLNEMIVRNEAEMSEGTLKKYQTALNLKVQELSSHEKSKPEARVKPPEDPSDEKTKTVVAEIKQKEDALAKVRQRLGELREERLTLTAESSTLARLQGHIENFSATYDSFLGDNEVEFEDAGFAIREIVQVRIDRDPIDTRLAEVSARLEAARLLVEGELQEDGTATKGLASEEQERMAEIKSLETQLNAPEKEYQAYLSQLAVWTDRCATIVGSSDKPDTIEYLKERIKRAKEVIPLELDTLYEERRELVRRIHTDIQAIRGTYEELYAPVQKIASDASGAASSLQLEFDAFLSTSSFEDNFLDFIRRNRKGSFYGEEESKKLIADLLGSHDFSMTEGVVAFTDAVMGALRICERDGVRESVTLESQLRQSKSPIHLYDFLFGLGYLEVRYTLRLGGKDISQLSPGEKGALLLVFYLLLDTEEIPIIIDQPEHNLDNESVVRLLVDCIRKTRARRQVLIVTHNPNLAVFCDADQIICCKIDKADGNRISYTTGAIEDYAINQVSVNVLEGTYPAFDNRRKKYHKPVIEYTGAATLVASVPNDPAGEEAGDEAAAN